MSTKYLQHATSALAICSLLTGLSWLIWTIALWYRLHLHIPWRDQYLILDLVVPILERGLQWKDVLAFLQPHYLSHRIALSRLLETADLVVGGGRNHIVYASAWLSMATIVAGFWYYWQSAFRDNWRLLAMFAGVLGCFLFGPSQVWNLIDPINASWALSFALTLLAFSWLLHRGGEVRWRDWLLVYTLTSLAAFSTFTGVIAWLLIPVAAWQCSYRSLAISAVVSCLLAFLYCRGLEIDATVAMQIADEFKSDNLRQAATDALASRTPLGILWRAALVLSWPLSGESPKVAGAIALLGSFTFLPTAARWLTSAGKGSAKFETWPVLAMLLAATCIGVALASRLGRIMQYPNTLYGPSDERYQTIVAVYWVCVMGIVLYTVSTCRPALQLCIVLAVILLTELLIRPAGNYLEQEIKSIELAKALFVRGARQEPDIVSQDWKNHFIPEYIFSFNEFFKQRSLAYFYRPNAPVRDESKPACAELHWYYSIETGRDNKPDSLHLRIPLPRFLITNEVWIRDREAEYTQLIPVHSGDYSPAALMRPSANLWTGILPDSTQPLELLAGGPAGITSMCTLQK